MKLSAYRNFYKIKLYELYQQENAALMEEIAALVAPNADTIAQHFYRWFLNHELAIKYLNHDDVKLRLQAQMTAWIKSIFVMKNTEAEVQEHIERQIFIGSVHARIALPVTLVNYGMTIVKDNISFLLICSDFPREKLSRAIMLMNGLIDTASFLMTESYVDDTIVEEKNAQSFRLHVSGHSLAFDCERLRSSLLDWLRQILLALHQHAADLEALPTIRRSDFGLWVAHRGELVLGSRPELVKLIFCIDAIDNNVRELLKCKHNQQEFTEPMTALSENVSKAIWILSNIAKEIIEIDSGRDVLTKLFNRRYIETIMRHETDFSLKYGSRFGVLYVDIDHFKSINDKYGHDNGDTVLIQMAEVLLARVRSSDFVFRMGGEEFLMVLSDITQESLLKIAEQIRTDVALHKFTLNNTEKLTLTVSIGAAIHDGHPDYNRTLKIADEGLYYSKHYGRNRVSCLQAKLDSALLN